MLLSLLSLPWWQLFILFLVGASIYWFVSMVLLRRSLPPGPFPLPILGNMHMMRGKAVSHAYFAELGREYGDPLSFWLGNQLQIVANKKENIREVLVNQQNVFCSRQDSVLMDLFLQGSQDIAFGKFGPIWRIHRKLASRSLRAVVSMEKLENHVYDVVEDIVEQVLTKGNDPVSIQDYLTNAVWNVICSFAYGQKYHIDDEEFQHLMFINKRGNDLFIDAMPWEFIPFSKYLPLKKISSSVKELNKLNLVEMEIIESKIDQHRETYKKGIVRDFVDGMIQEQKALKDEGDRDLDLLTNQHLSLIVMDFFSAGTETTSTALAWLFLFFTLHPEIQEECYQEIQRELGDRKPLVGDRVRLRLVEASISEALRLRAIVPLCLPHVPISDAKIGPYTIPAGTPTMLNLSEMQIAEGGDFDPRPEQFDPKTHFLDEDGQVRKPMSFMPFGGGKRVCLGEALARNDLFLITTNMLRNLEFCQAEGEEYSLEPKPGSDVIQAPLPYKVIVKSRK